jgi:hypothetical protein
LHQNTGWQPRAVKGTAHLAGGHDAACLIDQIKLTQRELELLLLPAARGDNAGSLLAPRSLT